MSVPCHFVPFPVANRRRTTYRRSKHELLDYRHVCAVASITSATLSESIYTTDDRGEFTTTSGKSTPSSTTDQFEFANDEHIRFVRDDADRE
jgi:hypothetical protein